jgi:hypothetical protein
MPKTYNNYIVKQHNFIVVQVQISPVVELCIFKPNRKRTQAEALLNKHTEERRKAITIAPSHPKLDLKGKYDHMYKHCPNAAVFSVLPDYVSEHTSNSAPHESSIPSPLYKLYDPKHTLLSESSLQTLVSETFKHIRVTEKEAKYLEELTRNQCASSAWYDYRKGLITLSHLNEVIKCKKKTYPTSIVKSIMQYYDVSANVPALKWGRENEIVARREYIKHMEAEHINFSFRNSGLIINPVHPYLGASPDGVMT